MDAVSVGLIPFTPLMNPPVGMNPVAWLQNDLRRRKPHPLTHRRLANFLPYQRRVV
ncbi:hypothetical protein JT359_06885 [Candidatus Poribacteria bacterium]|nr:hypothetical protein [Candidatus Poribacteria bacterium]